MDDKAQKEKEKERENANLLTLLDLRGNSDILSEINKLFVKQLHFDDNLSFVRIKCISNVYQLWVRKENKIQTISFHDAINKGLGQKYNFQQLLIDYKYCIDNKQTLLAKEEKEEKEDNKICVANDCDIMRRFERDEEEYNTQNYKLNALYFIFNNSNNLSETNDDIIMNILCQQTLDSIHCDLNHVMRITQKDILQTKKEKNERKQAPKTRHISYDENTDIICQIIAKKRKQSKRFNNNRRYKKFNKFISSSGNSKNNKNDKNVAIYQSVVYGNDSLMLSQATNEEICFIDGFFNVLNEEMNENLIRFSTFNILRNFIHLQEYDTDSLCLDFENDSNIIQSIQTNPNNEERKSVYKICHKFIIQTTSTANIYSEGWRFFYWPFFKNCHKRERIVFKAGNRGNLTESNEGYLLSEWYICSKYKNLKEEALLNNCCAFTMYQFTITFNKAKIKRDLWINDKNTRKLKCNYGTNNKMWQESYGIADGELIGLNHILSLLMYTNFSKQCYLFSKTFRKTTPFQSDRTLKRRHSEVANWAKHLRELIECFGDTMANNPQIDYFYHGISSDMIFKSTNIKLCGPVSTTLDFMTAVNFGSEGIVLQIVRDDTAKYFFDCEWWSDFSTESERLFIGGLQAFKFIAIRNIEQRKNYENFIFPLTAFSAMIRGYSQQIRKTKKGDVKHLEAMINEEMLCKLENKMASPIDEYILRLFHHFAINIYHCVINLVWMDIEEYKTKTKTRFGYELFRSLFLIESDGDRVNILYFLQFLVNLKSFTIFYKPFRDYKGSVLMDKSYIAELIKTIQFINNHKKLSKSFEEIVIVYPKLPERNELNNFILNNFISQNDALFVENGFKLTHVTYSDDKRAGSANSDKTLSIKKL